MIEMLQHISTPQDVLEFCKYAFSRYGKGVLTLVNTKQEVRFQVWHPRTVFNIVARITDDGRGYLGCISSSRVLNTGEDWHRGSDLPDGRICGNVMLEIMASIISYDAEDVKFEVEQRAAAQYESKGPALKTPYIIGIDPASTDVSDAVVMQEPAPTPPVDDIFVFLVEGRAISDYTRYDNALVLHDKMLGDITYPVGFPEPVEYKVVNKDKNHVSTDSVRDILAMLPKK